jgi:ComF family protein
MPPACAGCGLEGNVLCPACAAWLRRRAHEPPGVPLGLAWPLPAGLVQLEWCASFSGPVRGALHALKYRGELRLVAPLADALADRWTAAGVGCELLLNVPVHPQRRRERGFDQAEELTRATAVVLGRQALPALERVTQTAAMHTLGREERARNVGGAFRVRSGAVHRVAGRAVLVVDDVVTTGASLAGCAAALRDAGASSVAGLTVARER